MTDLVAGDFPSSPLPSFEDIKKRHSDGVEYWEARALMPLLDYTEWRNFHSVILRARAACATSGQRIDDHFVSVNKMIEIAKGGRRAVIDYQLSRYACYLIAQNADSTKEPVALAQTYFAVQTRRHELQGQLPEDQKRLMTRYQVVKQNTKLAGTAKKHGVQNFGAFNDAGYLGLYGLTSQQIRRRKGLGKDKVLDRAGREVRDTITRIGGVTPENLPPEEHIQHVEKRVGSDLQQKLRKVGFEEAIKDIIQLDAPEDVQEGDDAKP